MLGVKSAIDRRGATGLARGDRSKNLNGERGKRANSAMSGLPATGLAADKKSPGRASEPQGLGAVL